MQTPISWSFRQRNRRLGHFPGVGPRQDNPAHIPGYLTEPARQRAGAALAALLRPGGALLLGPTDAPPRGCGLVPWDAQSVSVHRREGPSKGGA